MAQPAPDFYLASAEHRGAWATPRACEVTARLRTEHQHECVMVKVDPPIVGQSLGLGDDGLSTLILAPRSPGAAFPKRLEQPFPVLIYRVLQPGVAKQRTVHDSDLHFSSWGELYPTRESAVTATQRSKKSDGPPAAIG